MIERLQEIERKYEKLTLEAENPEIAMNPSAYSKIAKEKTALEETVKTWREYQKIQNQIEDNKEIVKSNDQEMSALAKGELPELQVELGKLEAYLKKLLVPKDPHDDKDLILEIRAGTGGEEATLFVGDLLRMYQRYAEEKGWKFEIMDHNPTGKGGFKEVIAEVTGTGAFGFLKFESGVHRVQRVPETEASGRVHTSAVTVAVLPVAEEVDVEIDPKDLRIDTFRAGGAGGQHVNKTDSAIRITHIPTNVVVECQDDRSQHKNKAKAMKILRSKLLEAKREKQEKERAASRKQMVKTGDRSEKIRTYNFPQNRLTDHRIGLTLYNLDMIINGKLEEVLNSLREENAREILAGER